MITSVDTHSDLLPVDSSHTGTELRDKEDIDNLIINHWGLQNWGSTLEDQEKLPRILARSYSK